MNDRNMLLELIQLSVEGGTDIYGPNKAADFNRACDHIISLLRDSVHLFQLKSYNTALFLAITAIEEMAKAEIAIYRKSDNPMPSSRQSDPLFSHKKKQKIASLPTVLMGARLKAALGEPQLKELCESIQSGRLVPIREKCLYCWNDGGVFRTPNDQITKDLCRNITLFALEIFDDRLVGYTSHSMDLSVTIDELFQLTMNP